VTVWRRITRNTARARRFASHCLRAALPFLRAVSLRPYTGHKLNHKLAGLARSGLCSVGHFQRDHNPRIIKWPWVQKGAITRPRVQRPGGSACSATAHVARDATEGCFGASEASASAVAAWYCPACWPRRSIFSPWFQSAVWLLTAADGPHRSQASFCLAEVFRSKFTAALKRAFQSGRLSFQGSLKPLAEAARVPPAPKELNEFAKTDTPAI
jgi:hypothetical protein